MGMIRVSDEIEKQLKEIADGRSMTATVEMLLNNSGAEEPLDKLDYLESYIAKRFDKLESLFTDNLVDVVAAGRAPKKDPINLDWPDVQYLMFELLEDGAPEWTCKEASRGAHESSELDCLTWLVDDEFIYTTNGTRTNWLALSSRIKSYLGEHYDI